MWSWDKGYFDQETNKQMTCLQSCKKNQDGTNKADLSKITQAVREIKKIFPKYGNWIKEGENRRN